MGDTKPLAESIEQAFARINAFLETPEGREHAAHARAMEDRRRRNALRALAEERDVPLETGLRDVVLDDAPLMTDAMLAATDALAWRGIHDGHGRGRRPVILVVAGPPGTGKSAALSRVVAHHERTARYVTAAQVATTVRNGHSDPEAKWLRWERADLLAIDEVGVETAKDAEPITSLLLARWTHGGATIVAGNISAGGFIQRYASGALGERLADRLVNGQKAHGLDWYALCRGQSLRNPDALAAKRAAGGER